MIFLVRRDYTSYGFQFKNVKLDIIWALIFLVLIIIPSFLALMLGLITFDITRHQTRYFISTLIFQLIFTGVCEEITYRGYFQSRLNEAFDHPYILPDLKFGPGVIITSALFGLAHVFNPFNLIIGNYEFSIFSGLFAAQFGMLVGLIREKTENLLIPILIHGLYNGFVSFTAGEFSFLFIGIGWVMTWIFFFTIFIKKYKTNEIKTRELNINP